MLVDEYPEVDARRARLARLAAVECILRAREKYTPREWGIVQLYYKCGLSHGEIARVFDVSRPSISRSMRSIRRKSLGP